MSTKRLLGLLFVLFAMTSPVHAAGWWGGGGIGLGFGGDVDYVSIEPVIGYRINDRVTVGGRLVFRYRNDKRGIEDVSSTDYGAALFTRYFATKNVFLQGEYEYLNYEFRTFGGDSDREGFGSLFGGAGFATPIAKNGRFFVLGLYNFSHDDDERSPYAEPWVLRAGVGFAF